MNNGYVKSLDGVRALAIILVMSFHAGLNHFGWMGVQLFFVLSGYLITRILWSEKYKASSLGYKFRKFWVRRSLRIFPLYFGFLIFLGVSYLLFHFPSYYLRFIPYLSTYTFNYTRTFEGWEVTPLFTHLWSLSIEEQFYFFFPFIIFFAPARFIKYLMILVVLLAPLTRFLLGEYYARGGHSPFVVADTVYWHTLSHLDAFFAGGLITVLSLAKKIKRPALWLVISLCLAIAAGMVNYFIFPQEGSYLSNLGYAHGLSLHYEHVWYYSLLNFVFAALILLLVSGETALGKMLAASWLVRIGRVSYGMYIFHWAILVYFFQRYIPVTSFWTALLLFIPYVFVVYVFSELSYRFYEVQFIRLKDKFFPEKRAK